jgi:hypothetical protein
LFDRVPPIARTLRTDSTTQLEAWPHFEPLWSEEEDARMADDQLAPDGVAQLAAVILAETPSQLMRCARVVSKKAGDPTPAETQGS